jgi:mono/diheme cytochrome c family protein
MSRLHHGRLATPLYLFTFTFCLIFAVGCRMDMQDQPRYEVYEPSTFFKDGLASRSLVEGTVARGHLRADTEFYTGKIDRSQSGGGGSASPQQNAGGRERGGGDGAQQEGQTGSPQNTVDERGGANAGQAAPGNTSQGNASQAGGQTRASGAANQTGNGAASQGDLNDVAVFPFPVTEEIVTRGQQRYEIFCAMCHGATGYGDGMIVRRGFRKPPSYHTEELRNARVGHFFDVITNGWGSMPSYNAQIPARDRWAIIAYIRALQLSQQGTNAQNPTAPTSAGAPNTGGAK